MLPALSAVLRHLLVLFSPLLTVQIYHRWLSVYIYILTLI